MSITINITRQEWGTAEVTPAGLEGVDLNGDLTHLTDDQVLALGDFADKLDEYVDDFEADHMEDDVECDLFNSRHWEAIVDRYEQLQKQRLGFQNSIR